MAITVSQAASEPDFEQVPQGMHKAVCYRFVDAGTVDEEYMGEKSKKHKFFLFWELPGLKLEDDRPMSIFREYTFSLHEKSKFTEHLTSWMNRPLTDAEKQSFDLTSVLGKGCKLSVGVTSGGNAKVTDVHNIPTAFDPETEELRQLTTHNELQIFDLDVYCKEFSGEMCPESKAMVDIFDTLPRFIQNRINGSEDVSPAIPPCYEMQAALAKASKAEAAPVVSEPQPIENDLLPEDDIPF